MSAESPPAKKRRLDNVGNHCSSQLEVRDINYAVTFMIVSCQEGVPPHVLMTFSVVLTSVPHFEFIRGVA